MLGDDYEYGTGFPLCRLCGKVFTGRGHPPDATVHFNCSITLKHALARFCDNLRDALIAQKGYGLGYDDSELYWRPR